LSHKQLFLVLQCWDSKTKIRWCSILKSSPLHIEMQESSSNFTLWILFFFCVFSCVHCAFNIAPMSHPCLCFKNWNFHLRL
jgi:hypothetical protein